MTTFNTRMMPLAVALALCLPACGEGGSAAASHDASHDESHEHSADATATETIEESLDAAFGEEPIPSQDVADAAAEEEIDENNADEVLAELKAEIDG